VNISFGFDEGGSGANPDVGEWYGLENPAIVIERGGLLVAAAGNNADDPDSPGNGTEPQLSNLNIRDDADDFGFLVNGPGAFIIVGSVDENNVISSFSDRAGAFDASATTQTMDIFLVAPGEGIVAPWETETDGAGLFFLNGTSFAAPHVVGAAAILFQRWPLLTAKEVAEILFTTATDLGAVGVDEIYGRGLLNLAEAIKPQGGVQVNFVGTPTPVSIDDFSLILGAPFGDSSPVGLTSVMALDKFERDFYFDLSSSVYNLAANRQPVFGFLEQTKKIQFNQWQAGKQTLGLQVSQDFGDGFLETQSQFAQDTVRETRVVSGFAEGKMAKTWSWKMGIGSGLEAPLSNSPSHVRLLSLQGQDSFLSSSGSFALLEHEAGEKTTISFGVDMASNTGLTWLQSDLMQENLPRYAFAMQINQEISNVSYGFRLGQMIEKQSVLGSRSFGGFAVADSSATSFVALDGGWSFSKRMSFSASVEAGVTDVSEVSGSFFEGFNSFLSSSWQVQFAAKDVWLANSSFVLSASQPLRVENAVLSRHQAVGIDVNRTPIYDYVTSSLNPSGREVAVEAAYLIEGKSWSLQASLMHRFDAGHSSGLSDTAGLMWLKRRF